MSCKKMPLNFTNVDDAVTKLVKEYSTNFDRWFHGIAHEQRPAVLLVLAGYRSFGKSKPPIPMIYLLNSQANFAPQLFGNSPGLAGVPQYAVYLVHRYYDPTIPLEKAKCLTEYLIAETASQDPKVGGRIRMAEILPDTGYRELSEPEMDEIHRKNALVNQKMKDFFLAGVVV